MPRYHVTCEEVTCDVEPQAVLWGFCLCCVSKSVCLECFTIFMHKPQTVIRFRHLNAVAHTHCVSFGAYESEWFQNILNCGGLETDLNLFVCLATHRSKLKLQNIFNFKAAYSYAKHFKPRLMAKNYVFLRWHISKGRKLEISHTTIYYG